MLLLAVLVAAAAAAAEDEEDYVDDDDDDDDDDCLCLQYVGSSVITELDNPDATRLAIANIRQVSLV